MRILVTGGSGFVGYSFIKKINDESNHIRVCDIDSFYNNVISSIKLFNACLGS